MSLNKSKQKIQNLIKTRDIIKVSKFSILSKLNKLQKVSRSSLMYSLFTKEIIGYVTKRYDKLSGVLNSSKNAKSILWVFISFSSSLLSASYVKEEKNIINNFDFENDELVAIGDSAIDFAKNNNITPIYKTTNIKKDMNFISLILLKRYEADKIKECRFVYKSEYMINDWTTILPIDKIEFDFENEFKIGNKISFYPSLTDTVQTLLKRYVIKVSEGLVLDAEKFFYQDLYLRHEQSIKTIDERVSIAQLNYHKNARKAQTEELILISQTAKNVTNKERGAND